MRRTSPSLSVIGMAVAGAGLALLTVEVARALGGQSLGGLSIGLMWAGVGLLVVGMASVVLSLPDDRDGTDRNMTKTGTADAQT